MESLTDRRATKSQHDQWILGQEVLQIYQLFGQLQPWAQASKLEIQRDNHIEYLTRALRQLGRNFSVLDANRPWLCYWILHSIALLRDSVDDDLEDNAINFLSHCQDLNGGYGGGPGQMPHLATTYAAVNSLLTLGGQKALLSINREKLKSFLLRMKDTCGGFRMHDGGEIDVRACYTAISVASVLNLLDDELVKNVGNYVLSCQTYEGGFAGEPGSEAHGGYTFCGLATMILIGEVARLDLCRLIDWVVFRQGIEGGFQGRINKLVDGCYSFWQGGVCALIQRLQSVVAEQLGLSETGEGDCSTDGSQSAETSDLSDDDHCLEGASSPVGLTCHIKQEAPLNATIPENLSSIGSNFIRRHVGVGPFYNPVILQHYILLCCQMQDGGFRDKPGVNRDHYHTCYCLSGLSVCQYSWCQDAESPPLPWAILGPYSNLLEPVHPLYNVVLERYREAYEFFSSS